MHILGIIIFLEVLMSALFLEVLMGAAMVFIKTYPRVIITGKRYCTISFNGSCSFVPSRHMPRRARFKNDSFSSNVRMSNYVVGNYLFLNRWHGYKWNF